MQQANLNGLITTLKWDGYRHLDQKAQKYALNSQLQALQILTNDDEVEN